MKRLVVRMRTWCSAGPFLRREPGQLPPRPDRTGVWHKD